MCRQHSRSSAERLFGGFADDGLVALAGFVEADAGLDVFFGADVEVGGLAAGVLGVEVLEERDAPLAAGAGAEALADE